mmetsp:Transcript_5665/g.12303  ORF Transcript_5665/g.12303 Transcript_5665/m.12303 type:complete len:200 (+) Transcript_5665:1558-2157(+)
MKGWDMPSSRVWTPQTAASGSVTTGCASSRSTWLYCDPPRQQRSTMKVANADRMGDANSIGTSRSGARSELTDMRCRNMEANSTKPASQGGGRGGAGPGGDGGGGGGGERSLQSVQSVPSLQSLNSEPGPPSSQEPSFAHIPQSSVQVEPRGAGGTGGGGGGDPRTSFSGGSTAVSGGGGDDDRGVGFICGAGNGGCAM